MAISTSTGIGSRPFHPAAEDVLVNVSLGSSKDVDRAVAAARLDFPSFSESNKATRIELLDEMVRKLRQVAHFGSPAQRP